jgi:hypothetical protein
MAVVDKAEREVVVLVGVPLGSGGHGQSGLVSDELVLELTACQTGCRCPGSTAAVGD